MILNRIVNLTERLNTNNLSNFVTVGGMTDIPIGLIATSEKDVILVEGKIGKTYYGYTTNSGFKDSDRLTISGIENKLIVQSITNLSFMGISNQYKLVLFEGKQ